MNSSSKTGHGQFPFKATRKNALRFIPTAGALFLLAFTLYASQFSSEPAKTALVKVAARTDDGGAQARAMKAVAAGKKFLESLDEEQRGKASLAFNSGKKAGWSNLPVTMVPRNGVRMGDLSKAQHEAAMDLLAAVLSKEGYQKVIDIMDADEQLATGKVKGKGGKGGKLNFGKANYYLALFGAPSLTEPWLVQFGGHHLGVNVTLIAKNFVLTPTHTGTQPASYTRNGKSVRPLGGENDKAFELIGSLDEKQLDQAVLKQRVSNLLLGPGQDGKKINPQGIKGSALTKAQQAKLVELIGEWINIINDDAAAPRMAEIKANLADTYFAWSGPRAKGSAAYFRIQGPTLVIEYAPQGGTDHIHTVLRDPTNDYGQKLITR